jgi:hypothetical protein
MKNSDILNDLLIKQIKNVNYDKKLKFQDLKRLCKYITTSIFDENVCSIWNGYITNVNNIEKGIYINFYFNGKKVALHRLLYLNFVGELSEDEYLKFTCENKGKCCNIHHLKKFKYNKKNINLTKENDTTAITNIENMSKNNEKITVIENKDPFILSFD